MEPPEKSGGFFMTEIQQFIEHVMRTRNVKAGIRAASKKNLLQDLLTFTLDSTQDDKERMYASWVLSHIKVPNRHFTTQHFSEILSGLAKERNTSVLRNWLSVLKKSKVDETLEGEWWDQCYRIFFEYNYPVAARVYALYALFSLMKKYPELKSEINEGLRNDVESPSPSLSVALRRFHQLK